MSDAEIDEFTTKEDKPSKSWFGTLNNWTPVEYFDIVAFEGVKTGIVCKEVGKECGTPHLHFSITFEKTYRLTGLKKLLPRWNLGITRDLGKARTYCKKGGDFLEIGEPSKQGKRTDLAVACELAKESMLKVAEEMPETFVKYHRGLQVLRNTLATGQKGFVKLEVIVMVGKPGCGKSSKARDLDPELYNMPEPMNGTLWFDGYDGQETILFDDYYGSWMKYHTLLQLLDGYPMSLPVKGGFTPKRWKRVILTSNKHPTQWYERSECDALKRRITSIEEL